MKTTSSLTLLAVNATIVVAHAGVHRGGYALVTGEIKILAMQQEQVITRVNDRAREIGVLMNETVADAGSSTNTYISSCRSIDEISARIAMGASGYE